MLPPGQHAADRDKIELFFSARQLKSKDTFGESDPKLKLFYRDGNNPEIQVGMTEVAKNNPNPDWKTQIKLDYIFEISQTLRFEIWDHDNDSNDDMIGYAQATVGEIMGSRNQVHRMTLKDKQQKPGGTLIVKADQVKEDNNFIQMQWKGKDLLNTDGIFGKSDPFLIFFRKKDDQWLKVLETNFIKDNLNPIWPPIELMAVKLNNGNPAQPFMIECWDNSKTGHHTLIGTLQTTTQDMMMNDAPQAEFLLSNPKHKKPGKLVLLSKSIFRKPTFIDYLQGGEQINMMVAIDYTGSNGDPKSPNSLHSVVQGQMNQYQQALLSVSSILLDYDYDKKVPLYGFGGVPNFPNYQKNQADHCFPLTGNFQQPEVLGLQGIMDFYQASLQFVQLSGPTLFGPVIEYAKSVAQSNQTKDIYTVLLILTDGEIHDMPKAAELISQSSRLPLSIIIIGVGNEHFAQMRKLDGDDGPIRSQKSHDPFRDLVQFVAYQDHKSNPSKLAQEVLAELPTQLVAYKQLIGKKPNPHQSMHLSQMQ